MLRSQLSFPYAVLNAAAVTDPADGLPAAFRDPADGLSADFMRPRCWTPNGRTGRKLRGIAIGTVPNFVFCLNTGTPKTTTNFLCLGQNILVCDYCPVKRNQ